MQDQHTERSDRQMFVFACPCGYFDTSEERLCPECAVGLLVRIEVDPVEPLPWTVEQAMLNEATAAGYFTVGEDGKFHLTDKGRDVGR